MSESIKSSMWGRERLGLIMIIASLMVIVVILGLLFTYQQKSNEAELRSQGVNLVRLLSQMPHEQLVRHDASQSVLQLVRSHKDPDFAYAVVVDDEGLPLSKVTSPGVIVPARKLPDEPGSWLGEHELALEGTGQAVLEFYAPLLLGADLAGHIRLGYFAPGFGLKLDQVPFFATLALPIFLLTPLFYFLVKREIGPLVKINREIQHHLDEGSLQKLEIHADGELRGFMQQFNRFIEIAQRRVEELEDGQTRLLTSTKILSYKRARVETVLQALPDTVIVLDEIGVISFANDKLTALLGVPVGEIIGKRPSDWCRNEEVLDFLSRYDTKGTKGYTLEAIEFSPEHAPEKTIQVTTYPLFSPMEKDRVFGTLVVFRDVTLEMLAKQSRGEFVAHVAHELKTPLNVLAMYSEALAGQDGESLDSRIEAVNVIRDEVERLSTLINNLLSITKMEMGSLSLDRNRVKPRDFLQDCFDTASRNRTAQGLNFHLDLPKEMSAISVDKDLLRIAINNLLTNAIKYNIPQGHVTLFAEESEATICIGVRDTGIGIAPAEQQRIFEKFYRSSDDAVRGKSGHGLGLALAKDIVNLHHGDLRLDSIPGEGTEFIIELKKDTNFLQQAI